MSQAFSTLLGAKRLSLSAREGLEDEEPGKAGYGEKSVQGGNSLLVTVTAEDDFSAHVCVLSRDVRLDREVAPPLGYERAGAESSTGM